MTEDRNPNLTVSSMSLNSLGLIIFIVFLILKLVGVIDWSWLYITMPLWIPIGLNIAIFLITLTVYLIIGAVKEYRDNKFFNNRGKK